MRKIFVLAIAAAIAGCSGKPVAQTPAPAKAKAQPVQPAPSANLITGRVAETMNAAGYTYLRITTDTGDRWAAVRETKVKEGQTVTIATQMVAENFESKTLDRKFERIIFGSIAGDSAVAQPLPPVPAQTRVSVPQGGSTIAQVWAGKNGLKDKPVVVRGTVVKFLPEIMGKNWLHLRDGSGSREKGDDDLTVTTKEMVKVGDVVTVNGTLRVDKDFGAGYVYGVIVEDAKVQK